jgi:KipI family sensor histidine kinase inhibitor
VIDVVDTYPLGDSALTVQFGTERSATLLRQIHAAAAHLRERRLQHVEDIVPAYLAISVFYDGLAATYEEMKSQVLAAIAGMTTASAAAAPGREHVIPVHYEGADLEYVAVQCGITVDRVIAAHTGREYSVDVLGFVPGFAYMSEVDPAIQLPRRAEPRARVRAGSVAIAGSHTGIYPLDTPGGWHILGTTTVRLFDATREEPALLSPGDIVRFERA